MFSVYKNNFEPLGIRKGQILLALFVCFYNAILSYLWHSWQKSIFHTRGYLVYLYVCLQVYIIGNVFKNSGLMWVNISLYWVYVISLSLLCCKHSVRMRFIVIGVRQSVFLS